MRLPFPLTAPERQLVALPLIGFEERQIDPVWCSLLPGQLGVSPRSLDRNAWNQATKPSRTSELLPCRPEGRAPTLPGC